MSEHDEQVALFEWAALQSNIEGWEPLRFMFAIPNGGLRHKATAAKMKAEGAKPGVPDIFLPVPRANFCGLFIEMKHGRNTCTPEQANYLNFLDSAGFCTRVCYGFDEAVTELEWYLGLSDEEM